MSELADRTDTEYMGEDTIPAGAQGIVIFFWDKYSHKIDKANVSAHTRTVGVSAPFDFEIVYMEDAPDMAIYLEHCVFRFSDFDELEIWLKFLK